MAIIFIFLPCGFFLLFFPRLISVVGDWMSTILPHDKGIKDEKSAAKFHYIKTVSGKVVAQSVAFRVVSIYWQGVAPFP